MSHPDEPGPSWQRHHLLLPADPQNPGQGHSGLCRPGQEQRPLFPLQLHQQGADDRGTPQQLGKPLQHGAEEPVGQQGQLGVAAAACQVVYQGLCQAVNARRDAACVINLQQPQQ